MNKKILSEEIRWELSQRNRVAETARMLANLPKSRRDPWDATAAAKYIADVFLGLESLWKRRCAHLNEPWPTGPDSHARILNDFLSDPLLGKRLTTEIAQRLRLYKNFRHRFVHGYGFEPVWETVEEPLRLIPETIAEVTAIWDRWITELRDSPPR